MPHTRLSRTDAASAVTQSLIWAAIARVARTHNENTHTGKATGRTKGSVVPGPEGEEGQNWFPVSLHVFACIEGALLVLSQAQPRLSVALRAHRNLFTASHQWLMTSNCLRNGMPLLNSSGPSHS